MVSNTTLNCFDWGSVIFKKIKIFATNFTEKYPLFQKIMNTKWTQNIRLHFCYFLINPITL